MNLVARAKLVRHLTFPSPAKLIFTSTSIQHCNSYATKSLPWSEKDEEFTGKLSNTKFGTSNEILGVNNDDEFGRKLRDVTLDLQWWEGCPKGEDLWTSLVDDPGKWWDNRQRKENPNAPDFKHRENGGALWIDSAPSWVLTKLEDLRCVGKERDESWKSLLEDPYKWWDKRLWKKNLKAPDFLHKESKEALWINSAPYWVLTELEDLRCVGKEAKGDELWKSMLEDPSKWWDRRPGKKNPKAPDFKHRENGGALWIDSAPSWVLTELEDLRCVGKEAKRDELWKSMLEDPSKWWDRRLGKKNPKAPDFLHKESKEALWINSAPSWVLTELEDLQCVGKEAKRDELWKSMLEDPSKWWDRRPGKKNPKAPDFKHRENGGALWIDSAPSWVLTELEDLRCVGKEAKRDELWKNMLEDPSKWWDRRLGKKNPKAPDFLHKESKEALWINSAPYWVLTKLEDLRCVGKEAKRDELWKSLLEDPYTWRDKRLGKKNPKAPDFVHKESKEALWINSAPSWVLTELEDLRCVGKEAKRDELWKSILEDPSKWWDRRPGKKNPKAPDFVHKESKEALWIRLLRLGF